MKQYVSSTFFAICLLISFADAAHAQTRAENAAYLELLGNGGLFSVNYERAIAGAYGIRVGASYFPEYFGLPASLWFPVMLNVAGGSSNKKIELGAGAIFRHRVGPVRYGSSLTGFLETYYTITIAYRFESEESGRFFRASFSPIVGFAEGNRSSRGTVPSVGISFGRVF